MTEIQKNLFKIKKLMVSYAEKYGRNPDSIQLVGASKGQSQDKMLAAYQAGLYCFGENYLQEALNKIQFFAAEVDQTEHPIEWHFIGSIQNNKTKKIAENFAWAHSVANQKTAIRLNEQRPPNLPPLNICIEVNVDAEKTKTGIDPEQVLELAAFCKELPQLKLRGLMAIPHYESNFALQRKEFRQLAICREHLRKRGFELDTLSIGMSHDFEAAIAEGATIIRLGTAIFGERYE